ncbi:Protein CBG17217 [Caenorhabditis briggsae]|uniref:Uncharacterized protein n=3 Tax=Caenorhabditis briggsae TaxID=6238 RepID=A0AAE8ZW30_CAEBR|nr:Protein CBG17217 [Caenorhabditis briggsae]ULT81343.1 hypothetical protein L3Y34_011316 [Caenorhabditis briggsae]UMM40623.1 hypothetical protein L5515_017178 [Caenorhabditis briggsae]CAP34920.2 Protein CBG17217 [Caenorhabditis briggsae]
MVAISMFKQEDEKASAPLSRVEHHPLAGEHQSKRDEWNYELNARRRALRAVVYLMITSILLLAVLQTYYTYNRLKERQVPHNERGIQTIAHEYIAYTEKYNKSYSTSKESLKRLNAYYTTDENVANWNKQKEHGSAVYGHNDLSDWTDEEFTKTLLPKSFYQRLHKDAEFIKPIPESLAAMKGERNGPLPDFFDWRDRNVVTPVKAQGQCGSCWAFASTATVEAAYAIAHGEKRNLSEQTLLDCDLDDNACDGGDEDKAFRYIHRQGLAYAVDLPYVAHRQNTCSVDGHYNTTKIKAAYFLHHDEDSMINWLVNFGPVNIGMSVIQPMRAYKGGVFTPSEYACKNEVIGLHALLITGYGTSEKGEKYWIVKNSWGNTWGVENGYIYFARGINACGIEDEPIGILA